MVIRRAAIADLDGIHMPEDSLSKEKTSDEYIIANEKSVVDRALLTRKYCLIYLDRKCVDTDVQLQNAVDDSCEESR